MSTNFFDENPMFVLEHQSLDIIDVNQAAVEFYGFSKQEFRKKNISDLGERLKREELIDLVWERDRMNDEIWLHTIKDGGKKYIQFTHHRFNHQGVPARLTVAHDVTELIKNEETNIERFPQIKDYLDHSPMASIEWTKDFVVKSWSERAEELFGWTGDEVIGDEDFFDRFVHPDERQEIYASNEEAFKKKKRSYTVEGRTYSKDGNIFYCQWYNTLLYDDQGNLVSIHSLVHDVSERKRSEILFKALSEESLVGVYLIQDGVFRYINSRFAKIFNYSIDEIENKVGPLDLTHPEDQDIVEENLRKRLEGETKSIEYEFRCQTKEGKTIHVRVYGTRIEYLGKPAVIGTLVDITDKKHSVEQYKAGVESFEDLFDAISDAIYIQNKEGKFIKVNDSAIELNGYDRDFLIGNTPDPLAAPGKVDLEETHKYFEKALAGEPQHFEQWGIRKNGEIFPEEVFLNPATYFGEDVVLAISRDISERYEAEKEIRKSEERFYQLFRNAPIGIVMMNRYQEIKNSNKAFEEIFGYDTEEIRGLDIDQVIVPEKNMDEAKKASSKIFSGEATELISRRQHKNGSLIDVMIYGVPVVVDGRTESIFGIYVDISERKKAEDRIKKSLREKEVLLAEIHHRVKNNLAVITGLLELQGYDTTSEEAIRVLKQSQIRINSIALIHEKLYESKDLSRISFDGYMRELSDLVVDLLIDNEHRDVDITINAEPIPITINEAIPCGLIINELITNSYKHAFDSDEKGKIWIDLDQEDEVITLTFRDSGKGLPEGFDTENTNSLGLTLIRTLAQQLQGSYEFGQRQDGNGMKFHLSFKLDYQ
jgi:PAS domain S-box-containing protein